MTEDLRANLAAIRARIAARSPHPERVRLIGVTKGFAVTAAAAVASAGIADLGENYAQELLAKAPAVDGVSWHFLGPVQRNKVARLAPHVGWWHGIDRLQAGEAVARRAPGARVLVQVNVSGRASRPGVGWDDVGRLVAELRGLDLQMRGLMAVASPDPDAAEAEMRRLAAAAADLGLDELSMGMTGDLDIALAAGTTMIRIGRGLLGPRPQPPRPTE